METELLKLRHELALARKRINQLESSSREPKGFERRIRRAKENALLLTSCYIAGQSISRRSMEHYYGMSQRAWADARALLQMLDTGQTDDAIEQIDRAAKLALVQPDLFHQRVPKCRRTSSGYSQMYPVGGWLHLCCKTKPL